MIVSRFDDMAFRITGRTHDRGLDQGKSHTRILPYHASEWPPGDLRNIRTLSQQVDTCTGTSRHIPDAYPRIDLELSGCQNADISPEYRLPS